MPSNATGKPIETRADLAWDPEYLRSVPWLAEFADVPKDAAAPLWMTRPPAHAVGSYGPEVIAWAREELGIRLRWWQRLAITLQLAHDADGVLVFRTFIDSAPRRAGKSVRMRTVALWRLAFAHLFGETQLVMHTGSDLAICREIQRGAWVWATAKWGKDSVTKANGKEAIETWTGDRWLTRSQDAVYGYDVTLGMVDEGWDVKPETVNEGMEPATLERVMPQIHLTSTAHRRATSLMRTAISDALAMDDPEVCLLLWGAPPGSDPSDPEVWRAASPHWSEDRRKLIARKYEKALMGEADPQADDPDPMAGFVAQYLNVWRLKARKETKGEPITDADTWGDLEADQLAGVPAAAAIESWYSAGVSVALAWRDGPDTVVAVTDHPTLAAAAAHVKAAGLRRVTVGASLLEDPALKGLRPVKGEARTALAVTRLGGMIREDTFRHDGSEHLTGQVLEVRTLEGADGPRVVSSGRTDAIKAAVWAAAAAPKAVRRSGPPRVVLPSKIA
ncbi:HNH endonuclease [Nocardioides sp.]|uniref:HNH endonuclease n=1 Tax=Nocardioides sp. TaxID=35761 RepID=UPI002D0572F0|nr:HNH endonuclease [Nocardioides sp.]HSX67045.1 HNH endonuclease [Nocardioides sp.]